ncbi:MAG: hypothetical protein JWM80_6631 [Cyanobacteria bacterium RYN_339]|nr:hypothetical protein [Cyanobacteria bacterium RYN_339]
MSEKGQFVVTEQQDMAAALEATKAYVRGITKLTDVTCKVDRLEGGYARVSADSDAGQVTPIVGFARKGKDGKWEVLAMGSYFDGDFFKRHAIPAGLQKI